MTNDEKWRIWGAIDCFLDDCVDFTNIDQVFERYEEIKEWIWCHNGDHDMIPDQCGIPEHEYCRFCGVRQDTIDKRHAEGRLNGNKGREGNAP